MRFTIMKRFCVTCLAFLLWVTVAEAQTVPVQQAAQRLDASAVAFAQAAVGSPSTATVVVPTGMYAYITGISVDGCQNGTGLLITNGNITSTGLNTNPSWSYSMPLTVNGCFSGGIVRDFPTTPLKSQAGINVTVVSPTTSNW